jgi:hypothetical protein
VRGVLSYESLCNPTCEPQLLRVVASFGLLQSLLQSDPTRQCFMPTKAGCRNVTSAMRRLETIDNTCRRPPVIDKVTFGCCRPTIRRGSAVPPQTKVFKINTWCNQHTRPDLSSDSRSAVRGQQISATGRRLNSVRFRTSRVLAVSPRTVPFCALEIPKLAPI